MTSTLPSGEGTPGGAEPDGALEPDSDEPEAPLLGDPALDNEQEMQQASDDLQSSREKSSAAGDISDRLTAATRPETAEGERS
jgi:hypothetical protein